MGKCLTDQRVGFRHGAKMIFRTRFTVKPTQIPLSTQIPQAQRHITTSAACGTVPPAGLRLVKALCSRVLGLCVLRDLLASLLLFDLLFDHPKNMVRLSYREIAPFHQRTDRVATSGAQETWIASRR